MPARLTSHSYGKSAIRVTKVIRGGGHPRRHDLIEMSVKIALEGDFAASYESGDNAKIIATDSMKNTVYVLAKETDFRHVEDFAATLARHFVETYEQVTRATVGIEQANWVRIAHDGRPHEHAFTGGGRDARVCRASYDGTRLDLTGGLRGLAVLKTTASEFRGFVSDRYRTLKDASDRIFATTVDATWTYAGAGGDYTRLHAATKRVILATFASHHSLAVQQTLLEMGRALLAEFDWIDDVTLEMPNQHRIPANLEPFGLGNDNEVFVATNEPFGVISGTVSRE